MDEPRGVSRAYFPILSTSFGNLLFEQRRMRKKCDNNQTIRTAIRFGVMAETWCGEAQATSLRAHFHEELQVVLCEHRLVRYGLRGATIDCPLACVFLIEPGVVHCADVRKDQPHWGDLRTFLIPVSRFNFYLGRNAAEEMAFPSPVCARPALLGRLRQAHDLIGSDDTLAAEGALLHGLSAIADESQSSVRSRPTARSGKMERIREYLADDLSSAVGLAELATECCLSPFHLTREFREHFGLPPHAFRTQLRVLRGRDLLLRNYSISDAAQETGFSDQAHFTRMFKRVTGVSPGHYLRSKNVQDKPPHSLRS